MAENTSGPESEPRRKNATVVLTESEKRDLQFVANAREVSESDLIRSFLDFDLISSEAARIRGVAQQQVA